MHRRTGRASRVLVCLLTATALAVAPSGSTTAAVAAEASELTFSESPTQGWGVSDGVVYASATVGPVLFIGGTFTSVRDPATGATVARNRLAAFNMSTGALLQNWNPGADGTVRVLESDGTRLWVGGAFTSIGGVAKNRIAALDPATGTVLGSFGARASSTVQALEAIGGRLFVGGSFSSVNSTSRDRLAAVDAETGALVSAWNVPADKTVRALEEVPGTGTVAVGGDFTQLGGQPRSYLGSVSISAGSVTSWSPPPDCVNEFNPCTILSLTADSGLVYGAVAGDGGSASAWSTTNGQRRWTQSGDGDVQAVELIGGTLYAGGHFTPQFGVDSSTGKKATRHEVAALEPSTGKLLPWAPNLSGGYGVWTIAGGADGLWLGGGYTGVNGSSSFRKLSHFPVAATRSTFVAARAAWSYRDDGVDLGSAWRQPAYDDAAWRVGAAELGFGDGDEQTVLRKTGITYYFRNAFNVTNAASISSLRLSLVRDDGAIVYINGTEVARSNMPAGEPTASTKASTSVSGSASSTWFDFDVPPRVLVEGRNVIAVEIHNSSSSSSDISFAASLVGS